MDRAASPHFRFERLPEIGLCVQEGGFRASQEGSGTLPFIQVKTEQDPLPGAQIPLNLPSSCCFPRQVWPDVWHCHSPLYPLKEGGLVLICCLRPARDWGLGPARGQLRSLGEQRGEHPPSTTGTSQSAAHPSHQGWASGAVLGVCGLRALRAPYRGSRTQAGKVSAAPTGHTAEEAQAVPGVKVRCCPECVPRAPWPRNQRTSWRWLHSPHGLP